MKRIAKIALGALLLAGATAVTTAPADAHVSFGISVGVPGYYGPPPGYYGRPDPYCDPYSSYYDPYDCDDYGPPGTWDEPVFYDGIWFNGPLRWRWYGGHRQFYYHGGWHGGSGWHDNSFHHGGGHWSGGHGGGSGGHSGGHWGHHH